MWDDDALDHIAQHGITPEDFSDVMADPDYETRTWRTHRRAAVGTTRDGRTIMCIYEQIDDLHVQPVTAFELEV